MLSFEEKNRLAVVYSATCKSFEKVLDPDVLKLQIDDLSDFDFEQITHALSVYRTDPKNRFWPKASEIRAIINPQPDTKQVAIELAYKIDKAVKKHGYNWASGQQQGGATYYKGGSNLYHTFKDAVIAELGPLGWHAICARGGWLSVRNSANEMDEGIFIAQMRDQIQASYSLEKQGFDITQIEMPKDKAIESNRNAGLTAIDFNNLGLRNEN